MNRFIKISLCLFFIMSLAFNSAYSQKTGKPKGNSNKPKKTANQVLIEKNYFNKYSTKELKNLDKTDKKWKTKADKSLEKSKQYKTLSEAESNPNDPKAMKLMAKSLKSEIKYHLYSMKPRKIRFSMYRAKLDTVSKPKNNAELINGKLLVQRADTMFAVAEKLRKRVSTKILGNYLDTLRLISKIEVQAIDSMELAFAKFYYSPLTDLEIPNINNTKDAKGNKTPEKLLTDVNCSENEKEILRRMMASDTAKQNFFKAQLAIINTKKDFVSVDSMYAQINEYKDISENPTDPYAKNEADSMIEATKSVLYEKLCPALITTYNGNEIKLRFLAKFYKSSDKSDLFKKIADNYRSQAKNKRRSADSLKRYTETAALNYTKAVELQLLALQNFEKAYAIVYKLTDIYDYENDEDVNKPIVSKEPQYDVKIDNNEKNKIIGGQNNLNENFSLTGKIKVNPSAGTVIDSSSEMDRASLLYEKQNFVFKIYVGTVKSLPDNFLNDKFKITTGKKDKKNLSKHFVEEFNSYEGAELILAKVKKLNFNGSYIVAYLNGRSFTLQTAKSIIEQSNADRKKKYDVIAQKEVKEIENGTFSTNRKQDDYVGDEGGLKVKNIKNTKSLLYTVQIATYTKPIQSDDLKELNPIYGQKVSNGIRYYFGKYTNYDVAQENREKAVDAGFTDAFVVAFYYGSQIDLDDAINGNFPAQRSKDEQVIMLDKTGAKINPIDISTTSGLVYVVHLLTTNELLNKEKFSSDWTIFGEKKKNGMITYSVGTFDAFDVAQSIRQQAIKKGFKDAFVASYKDGKSINLAQAEKEPKESSKKKVKVRESNVCFMVQVASYDSETEIETVQNELKTQREIAQFQNNDGKFIYTIGNTTDFQSINKLLKQLKKEKITGFVVAWDGNKKIPVDKAKKLISEE